MSKVAKTFRLEKDVASQIVKLQEIYRQKLNISVSQADVIKILVNNEFDCIDEIENETGGR